VNRRILLIRFALSTVLLIALAFYLHHRFSAGAAKLAEAPRVMLWAWERPEHLKTLNTANVGVAFLAESVYLKQGGFAIRPRMQPLEVNQQTYLEAVVRIEDDRRFHWNPTDAQLNQLATAIVTASSQPGVRSLQIDFDAKASERDIYKHLLVLVREKLPKDKPLSMTALASWCLGDKWVPSGLVHHVVPMLFSMGVGKQDAFDFIENCRPGDLSYFQQAVGLSISDDAPLNLLAKRTDMSNSRIYFFSGHAWNPNTIQKAQGEVHKWLTASAI
jgi:hypothetical protein